jgi:hypothetical protein
MDHQRWQFLERAYFELFELLRYERYPHDNWDALKRLLITRSIIQYMEGVGEGGVPNLSTCAKYRNYFYRTV